MKWNWKQEFLKMEREGSVGPSDQSKKISFGSDLCLTAGRNNFSRPKRSILFIFRPKFSEILLNGKHAYASPSSVFFLTQFCISLGKNYRRNRNSISLGRKENVRKRALVISLSQGKWSFFRSLFQFYYLQHFAIFPFFHLFCFCFASCYFIAFGCRFSTKIKTVTLIIQLCNHNSAALFKTDKK